MTLNDAARAIFKFPVEAQDEFTLEVPRVFSPLCVQIQNGKPQIWALVDPYVGRVKTTFKVHATGMPFPTCPTDEYIGTFQLEEEHLVFHLFWDPRSTDSAR